jgi:hypothetical protein
VTEIARRGHAGQLTVDGRTEAEIEQPEDGLERGEESDEAVRLDPQEAEVQRDEREPEHHDPRTADEIGRHVAPQIRQPWPSAGHWVRRPCT